MSDPALSDDVQKRAARESTSASKKRRWIFTLVGITCAIAVVLVGSYALYGYLVRPSHSSLFRAAACPFTPGEGIAVGKELTCGFLTVPEDRSKANGDTIQLAVAIFKPAATVSADPMVYLSGGPGGSLLSSWGPNVSVSTLQQITQGHTLIMFDQRGTGYSQPALGCNELTQFNRDVQGKILGRADWREQYVAAGKKCHDRLISAGIDLQAYTTIASAHDVHDLIDALGYQKVNLYGVSYGTRLALTVMRLFPSDIRSVILDSTLPTQTNLFTTYPAVEQRGYDTLFKGCVANPKCHSAYPQLESVFYRLINDLNARPVIFQDKQYGSVALDGQRLADWVLSMLYVTEWLPLLPKAIMQISQGHDDIISRLYGFLMLQSNISYGVYYSVECGEDLAFTTEQDLLKATVGLRPELRPHMQTDLQAAFSVCQLWGQQAVPNEQKQPVTSSLPTLILAGEYDPITPTSNAELALQTLSRGNLFQFPATGHGVFGTHACPDSIVAAFLQHPTTRPDGLCISGMSAPNFL